MASPPVSAVATPISGAVVAAAIVEVGATHLVTVPDTNLRTVLRHLGATAAAPTVPAVPTVRAATEDDVLGICAGLWLAGARPVALMQQVGLFASVNSLRAFTHDQRIPLAIVAGLYGRDVTASVPEQRSASVRLCPPLLDALGIRWQLIEGPAQAGEIAAGLALAYREHCTSVVLIGAPTS
jgi:sulfopyruvate decarboxylase subunit alpha